MKNYTLAQVKPIIERCLAAITPEHSAAELAKISRTKQGAFTVEIEGGKYRLFIFAYGISLYRYDEEIHHSKTRVTHVSRYLTAAY